MRSSSEAGLPTVHAVSKAIVIGTSHGLVLVFDHQEHLRAILGNNEHIEYGAVTAIDVTPDGLWVATGHQNGYVIVWDVAQATEIKVLTELHKGSPVVHVRFVRNVAASPAAGKSSPNHSHVLSIDLVGVVYRTTLTSLLLYYSVASVKLLDGGSGQILAVAVLQAGNVPHATDSMGLVAMCSSTATFVIATSPDTALVFKLKHPDTVAENKMALPYLTWRSAYGSTVSALPGEHSKPRVRDPVLAIAYGRHVSLFQAVPSSVRDRRGVEFIRSSQYTTDITLAGVHWLGTQGTVLSHPLAPPLSFSHSLALSLSLSSAGATQYQGSTSCTRSIRTDRARESRCHGMMVDASCTRLQSCVTSVCVSHRNSCT